MDKLILTEPSQKIKADVGDRMLVIVKKKTEQTNKFLEKFQIALRVRDEQNWGINFKKLKYHYVFLDQVQLAPFKRS